MQLGWPDRHTRIARLCRPCPMSAGDPGPAIKLGKIAIDSRRLVLNLPQPEGGQLKPFQSAE